MVMGKVKKHHYVEISYADRGRLVKCSCGLRKTVADRVSAWQDAYLHLLESSTKNEQ